jgi:hypothetical protein
MGSYRFLLDERLGIELPQLDLEWELYTPEEQSEILMRWELIRGRIPDRIAALEEEIRRKQERLNEEEHFPTTCRLNAEIAELASRINDLNLWYRVNQTVQERAAHM